MAASSRSCPGKWCCRRQLALQLGTLPRAAPAASACLRGTRLRACGACRMGQHGEQLATTCCAARPAATSCAAHRACLPCAGGPAGSHAAPEAAAPLCCLGDALTTLRTVAERLLGRHRRGGRPERVRHLPRRRHPGALPRGPHAPAVPLLVRAAARVPAWQSCSCCRAGCGRPARMRDAGIGAEMAFCPSTLIPPHLKKATVHRRASSSPACPTPRTGAARSPSPDSAVVSRRDGILKFMFRIADFRSTQAGPLAQPAAPPGWPARTDAMRCGTPEGASSGPAWLLGPALSPEASGAGGGAKGDGLAVLVGGGAPHGRGGAHTLPHRGPGDRLHRRHDVCPGPTARRPATVPGVGPAPCAAAGPEWHSATSCLPAAAKLPAARRLLPIIVEHTIDEQSPLCGHTFDTLMQARPPQPHSPHEQATPAS